CTFVYPVDATTVTGTSFPDPPVPSGVSGLPNAMRDNGEGIPFPSSFHPGIVNVVFCDGSATSLSDNIDRTVYVRLVTPAGTRIRFAGFRPEDPVSASDY
ncbi:MAG: DUF1559 domain-containing protein, partial [Planctomycetaceae bacterium]|nr:DUF1559 domain-containing protein [Planctomycetaceae bacterium]